MTQAHSEGGSVWGVLGRHASGATPRLRGRIVQELATTAICGGAVYQHPVAFRSRNRAAELVESNPLMR